MTWREFQLRLAGYKRAEINKWYHTREIAYQIYISTPIKGKHISKDRYMKLDEVKSSINSDQRELIKDRMKIAVQQAKERANGG